MYVSVCMILAHECDAVHPVANIFKMLIFLIVKLCWLALDLQAMPSARAATALEIRLSPAGFKILKLWLNTSCGLCLLLTPSISLTDWST